MLGHVKAFLPAALGLVCARTGLIVTTYGSYTSTDENILTDGSTLVALTIILVGIIAIASHKTHLSQRLVENLQTLMIGVEGAAAFGLAYVLTAFSDCFEFVFALSIICTLAGWMCIFYWLRTMCTSSAIEAVVFSFAALAASEVLLLVTAALPDQAESVFAGILALCQLACVAPERRTRQARQADKDDEPDNQEILYSGFGNAAINKTHYLIAMAFGIGALSIVIGVLRGYPDGTAIPFSPASRIAYAALTIVLSLSLIGLVTKGRRAIVSVGIFTAMEALACTALILYAAFPDTLEIGAVATTTLNALMVGYTWYVIIVFMAHGWRDPYYYAFGGWIVWLGCRATARIALLEFHTISANDLLVTAILGGLIVFSTQIVLIRLLSVSNEALSKQPLEAQASEQNSQIGVIPKPTVIELIMGLDNGPAADNPPSLSEMREQAMRRCAEEMGRQFLLSAREVDVLSLYALGYTQKRVAEELFISQSTAHAHIKHIYSKTDMHSRQELIDYLERYTQS